MPIRFEIGGVTTVVDLELSGRENEATGLGGAMLQRTIADAAQAARNLDLEAVFDRRPMYRWLIMYPSRGL